MNRPAVDLLDLSRTFQIVNGHSKRMPVLTIILSGFYPEMLATASVDTTTMGHAATLLSQTGDQRGGSSIESPPARYRNPQQTPARNGFDSNSDFKGLQCVDSTTAPLWVVWTYHEKRRASLIRLEYGSPGNFGRVSALVFSSRPRTDLGQRVISFDFGQVADSICRTLSQWP